jgi:hypothetical protein
MTTRRIQGFALASIPADGLVPGAEACTSLLVTKGGPRAVGPMR